MGGIGRAWDYIRQGKLRMLALGGAKEISERYLDGVRVTCETNSPRWLADDRLVEMERDPADPEEFYAVLESGDDAISVDPPVPTAQFELTLFHLSLVSSVTVRAEGTTPDGSVLTSRSRIANNHDSEYFDSACVSFAFDDPVTSVTVTINPRYVGDGSSARHALLAFLWDRLGESELLSMYRPLDKIRASPPFPSTAGQGPPVVLVSIDTLRYDQSESLAPLLAALGDDAVVPSEPRTNGIWTPPSHACMFTGTHPGVHGYNARSDGVQQPIHPTLDTLAEVLFRAGYKCSGVIGHSRMLPQYGFGRGFARYRVNDMTDWIGRDPDARSTIDDVVAWIESDVDTVGRSLFYFVHLFDPHQPYIPPLPAPGIDELDLEELRTFRDKLRHPFLDEPVGEGIFADPPSVETERRELVRSYYRASIEHTARQVRRLVETLRARGLYEDSLFIVTGDHGEEWGESGYYKHFSTYDANLRPFMAIKPPKDADWSVPDRVDTIDFLPTVARAVGEPVPEACQGTPLQEKEDTGDPRLFEGFGRHIYMAAVEWQGIKAIHVYDGNYPDRPTPAQIDDGPLHREYYEVSAERDGIYEDCREELDDDTVEALDERICAFVGREPDLADRDGATFVSYDDHEPERHLEYLGYK